MRKALLQIFLVPSYQIHIWNSPPSKQGNSCFKSENYFYVMEIRLKTPCIAMQNHLISGTSRPHPFLQGNRPSWRMIRSKKIVRERPSKRHYRSLPSAVRQANRPDQASTKMMAHRPLKLSKSFKAFARLKPRLRTFSPSTPSFWRTGLFRLVFAVSGKHEKRWSST